MKKILANLLQILGNVKTQINLKTTLKDDDKAWTEVDHQEFLRNFHGIVQILSQEVNKITLIIDVTSAQKPSNEAIQSICDAVGKASVTLLSVFCSLSVKSGANFSSRVTKSCQEIINLVIEVVTKLSQNSKREFVLQNVGRVWEKCDLIVKHLPQNNVDAVAQDILEQKSLVHDALNELEEAKCLQKEEDIDENDKWNDIEMVLLPPALGLLKTAQALLKKIHSTLKGTYIVYLGCD
jgi:hypothetical protein